MFRAQKPKGRSDLACLRFSEHRGRWCKFLDVIAQLHAVLISFQGSKSWKDIVEPREEVITRFQLLFSPEHIPTLTAEEFQSFLRAENNRHWSGLQGRRGQL